ncbi:Expansin 2 [Fusarium albosuccineum]|uniref:Expansin 2 n=1 Tax=Fusarium albosuccineum TaxID=1237068 RepID=A0A8H4PAV7_9HYPO|nr:Expansin 2 [Fusarium albosuccineum]
MKFLLPILLAAPAVMGRACKVRHSHSSKPVIEAPANTQDGAISVSTTAAVPQVEISQAPVGADQPSNDVSSVISEAAPQEQQTTLATSVAPTTPSASAEPETGSGESEDLGGSAKTGSSTFYGGNLEGGNCMFSTYTLPSGIYGTAFSGAVWDDAASCGACVEVTGPNGTITAMIVDQCPECEEGHLDLFPDAFTAVGGTDGIVDTSYKFVTCGITTPLVLKNKEGTSSHWFSMLVQNHNEPVESLEVSTDGGSTWQTTERQDYNFFENSSGFGTDTVDVRVTSTTGKTVTVKNVGVEANSEYEASGNF